MKTFCLNKKCLSKRCLIRAKKLKIQQLLLCLFCFIFHLLPSLPNFFTLVCFETHFMNFVSYKKCTHSCYKGDSFILNFLVIFWHWHIEIFSDILAFERVQCFHEFWMHSNKNKRHFCRYNIKNLQPHCSSKSHFKLMEY